MRRLTAALPVVSREEFALLRRLLVIGNLLGGLTLVAVLFTPDPNPSDHTELTALVVATVAMALLYWVVPVPRWVVAASPYTGVVLVSAICAFARPIGAVPFFYLWPVLLGAYFLPRRHLVGVLVTLAVTYAGALAIFAEPGIRLMLYIGAVMCIVVVGVLVNAMKLRLDRLVAELRVSASTDPLTGLLNRREFERVFDRALALAERSGGPLTLALFDLDFFKQVNDRLGHAGGDRALLRVAEVLRAQARGADVVARLGGEEFGVLLPGTDADGGRRYAERVAAALAEGKEALSVSAGLAAWDEDALGTRGGLMLAADDALYAAKAAGRRRVVEAGGATSALPAPAGCA